MSNSLRIYTGNDGEIMQVTAINHDIVFLIYGGSSHQGIALDEKQAKDLIKVIKKRFNLKRGWSSTDTAKNKTIEKENDNKK